MTEEFRGELFAIQERASKLRNRLDALNLEIKEQMQAFAFRKKLWLDEAEWTDESRDRLESKNQGLAEGVKFTREAMTPLAEAFDIRLDRYFESHRDLLNYWVTKSEAGYIAPRVASILMYPESSDQVLMLEAELNLLSTTHPEYSPEYAQAFASLVEQFKILFIEEKERLRQENVKAVVLEEGYWESKYWPAESRAEFDRHAASLLKELREVQKEFSDIPYEDRYPDEHYLVTSYICNRGYGESFNDVTDVRELTLDQLGRISETFPQYRSYYDEKLVRELDSNRN